MASDFLPLTPEHPSSLTCSTPARPIQQLPSVCLERRDRMGMLRPAFTDVVQQPRPLRLLTCVTICQATITILTDCNGMRLMTRDTARPCRDVAPSSPSCTSPDTRYIAKDALRSTRHRPRMLPRTMLPVSLSGHSRQVNPRRGAKFALHTEQSGDTKGREDHERSIRLGSRSYNWKARQPPHHTHVSRLRFSWFRKPRFNQIGDSAPRALIEKHRGTETPDE